MFDTIAPKKQTTRVLVLFLLSGLPSPLSGRTSVAGNAGVTRFSKVGAVSSPSAGVGAATVQAPSPSYDITIQDDASGDMLRFNKTTGEDKFSRCGNGYVLTGVGTPTIHGCKVTLNHTPSDRRVSARADTCTKRTSASVQVFALAATYRLSDSGPPMCHMTMFPNEFDTQPGETTPIYVFSCGGTGAVVWSATAGTITPEASSDPDVFAASYTVPDDSSEPDTATIQADFANGSGTSSLEIQKVKLKRIDTCNAQGDTGGKLTPDGGTRFVLTGKKEFPNLPLRIIFRQGDLSIPVDIGLDCASRPEPKQLAGTAPANTLFVGDAAIYVFADNGQTKISKKTLCNGTGCSVYYSFDPPTPPTSISAPGFNRSEGNLTIRLVVDSDSFNPASTQTCESIPML